MRGRMFRPVWFSAIAAALLLGSSGTLTVQPAFYQDPGYDPRKDFAFTSLRKETGIKLE